MYVATMVLQVDVSTGMLVGTAWCLLLIFEAERIGNSLTGRQS